MTNFNTIATKLNQVNSLFWVVIIAVLVFLYCIKGCGKEDNKHIEDAGRVAAMQVAIDSSYKAWRASDSAKSLRMRELRVSVDSLKERNRVMQSILSASQRTAASLAADITQAKQQKDTAEYVNKCDSLAGVAIDLSGQVEAYRLVNNALAEKMDSLNASCENRLKDALITIRMLNDSLNTSNTLYQGLSRDYNRAVKKAAKQWSVSVGPGYGVTPDGKVGPTITLNIGRTLFRF